MDIGKLLILKLRRVVIKRLNVPYFLWGVGQEQGGESDPNKVSSIIRSVIDRNEPFLITRFGSTELDCILNFLGKRSRNPFDVIFCKKYPWWYLDNVYKEMPNNSGFFPAEDSFLDKFSELILNNLNLIDYLASWMNKREDIVFPFKQKFWLTWLDPFWSDIPWTKALEGKKVLVVHPFKDSIEFQYKRRNLLFSNKDVLPVFKTFKVIRSVSSLQGHSSFPDWFEALEHMKIMIQQEDFDIALIGCGAYGMPLAMFCKQIGKSAIHMGGSLQLLFGIEGRRWNSDYHKDMCGGKVDYGKLPNEYWIRPLASDTCPELISVEGGCYL